MQLPSGKGIMMENIKHESLGTVVRKDEMRVDKADEIER